MRDRRRKKRLAEKGELHVFVKSDEPRQQQQEEITEETTEAVMATASSADVPSSKAATSSVCIHRSKKILIPLSIQNDTKRVKKFRKDSRRQARSEGRDDSELVFVLEKTPANRKTFPRINDMLEQEEKQQKKATATNTTRHEDTASSLPDDIKRKFVALDCEMVGTGANGQKSVLARASIVDWWGTILLDTYVKVPVTVTDFRTQYSGILPKHLQRKSTMDPAACRQTVADLLRDKILVGHALHNDLNVLMLQHQDVRDTATFRPLQRLAPNGKWRPRKLKDLVEENCDGLVIQEGSHDSVQDARASMQLFQSVYAAWEQDREAKEALRRKKKR